ncbi:MAG: aminotransferase class V-fold PLP-dependent enzyme, partial [Armatimonadetes bacterium]|nr:aminotransferase class V-fold PLP-dependent enzyme [Anaerolineae bacterium]
MRDLFLIDPNVIFLNHGSFGACPRPVFEAYQRWQRTLERQPVEFLGRRYHTLLDDARAQLAAYLQTDSANVVFVTNATAGVNTVAHALDLQPGDEVLTTDHEYGACENTWRWVCEQRGAQLVRAHVPLPLADAATVANQIWASVTPRTRILFLSHISSQTAITFPIAALCQRARAAGIVTVIDGAHAPGQIPLDLDAIGANFYTGNLHKWLCT